MSKTDDNTPIDNELKAYLAGQDGVSAAYRQTGEEEPPADLDNLILAAARHAVEKDTSRKTDNLRQKFPLAASFMVGVLVTAMYFNQGNEIAGTVTSSGVVQEQLISESVQQPAPVFAPAAPPVATGQESDTEVLERDALQQAGQFTQQATRAVAIAPQDTPAPVQNKTESSQASAKATETQSIAADANADVQDSAIQGAAPAANTALPLASSEVARAESDSTGTQLEEIAITGSRIRAGDEFDLSYRQTREEWLRQILALGEDAIDEVDQLEEINTRLEEEITLFSEAFPDFDLEAQLQSLEPE